jgi:hypothetical protein
MTASNSGPFNADKLKVTTNELTGVPKNLSRRLKLVLEDSCSIYVSATAELSNVIVVKCGSIEDKNVIIRLSNVAPNIFP